MTDVVIQQHSRKHLKTIHIQITYPNPIL